MLNTSLETLIDSIIATPTRKLPNLSGSVRKQLKRLNVKVNPLGMGNSKTGVPSTYRPVGETCPSSCRFLGNGCYAQQGNVNLHAQRASDGTEASTLAAAAVMAMAARLETKARLHVSGDFLRQGRVDTAYVLELVDIADRLKAKGFKGPFAWAYTHIPESQFAPYADLLEGSVTVLYSDEEQAGGAVVWEFDKIDQLKRRNPALTVVKCPAQTTKGKMQCADCNICWNDPKGQNRLVVFDPHGSMKRRVARLLN